MILRARARSLRVHMDAEEPVMNVHAYRTDLPLVWHQPEWPAPHRRNRLGELGLSEAAVDVLNEAINTIDGGCRPLTADLIASCGRKLLDGGTIHTARLPADCILERFKTIGLLDMMVKDGDWRIEDLAAYRTQVLLDYVKLHEELIPHDAPCVGHLDDAILMDAAWRSLREEIVSYADYRRLRKLEAELQGRPVQDFRYFRDDWLESREAEKALIRHRREVALSSYVSRVEVGIFRVH